MEDQDNKAHQRGPDDIGDLEDNNDDDAAMRALMGFSGFGSTKNTKVVGNARGAVRKDKKSQYRQYMNRQGGFNRALSPTR